MLKNYLTIAFRNFRRHKSFSLINLAGLAVGMACFILMMLYVQYELSFDRYHENAERIYRVVVHQPGSGYQGCDHYAVTQALLGSTLKAEYPEVRAAVTLDDWNDVLISVGEKNFFEDGLIWANADLFKMFTFPLVRGDPAAALAEPFSLVLSEEFARKFFGEDDPIGKTVTLGEKHDLKVTGVMLNVPENSHFTFNMAASLATLQQTDLYSKEHFQGWGNNSFYTYILVHPEFNPKAFEAKLAEVVKKYHTESWRNNEKPNRYYLQALTDIHLRSQINFDIGQNGDIRHIYLLSGLAFLILIIACINYVNLTTARAAMRAKEVGMRKVVGAIRGRLIRQFVGESLLLTALAVAMALLIVAGLLPAFSQIVEREISFNFLGQTKIFGGLLAVIAVVGMIAGGYPAFYLARFEPARVLKGEQSERNRSNMRSALVVFQFAASVGLILCAATIQQQMRYIKNKKLGYNREQVLVMRLRDAEARKQLALIKRELLQNPQFVKIAASGSLPTNINSRSGLGWTQQEGGDMLKAYNTFVDHDFLDVFEIALAEGRNFSRELATDSTQAFIINEKLRHAFGWESGVGQPFGRGDKPNGSVIGVMKDFHIHSLRQEIHPLFLQIGESRFLSNLSARIRTSDISAAIEHARKIWQKHSLKYPFEYFFLDDEFDRMYKAEQSLGEIFGYFMLLAIFIASLGLFGLASYAAARRTKEIGVRKVLGATMSQLLVLLSTDFTKLVLLANLFAWPVAWYAMNQWLQGFAYRVSMGLPVFLLSAIAALLITLITVSFQTVKAALANPVEALRYE
ncbi:ABC transporter permease [candidate division KSB1 bacterium]|nr:ABC transporter permease [candidate division KSB1 bacterium]